MKFANLQDISGYSKLLKENGCTVLEAEDTGRFAEHTDLTLKMIDMQLTFDLLKIISFNVDVLQLIVGEFAFHAELARAGKVAQARFIARRE